MLFRTSLSLALLLTAAPVFAQDTAPAAPAVVQTEPRETIEGQLSQERTVIAVPAFATPSVTTVAGLRSEEHTSELQSLMRISYAVFCLKKKQNTTNKNNH